MDQSDLKTVDLLSTTLKTGAHKDSASILNISQMTRWRFGSIFMLSLALLFLAGLFYKAAFPVDDAYITYRYAENLSKGLGLVYNPGLRVEGYTNFAQVLLLTPFAFLGKRMVPFASIVFGLCSWSLIVAVCWRHMKRIVGDESFSRPEHVTLLWLSVCTPAVMWSWSGMETASFSLMWVLAWMLHLFESEKNEWPWLSGIVTFAAGLFHPDGVLIGIVLIASWLIPFNGKRIIRAIVYTAFAWGLFGVYWLWRWQYFHSFFPNTFYAKVGDRVPLFKAGLKYIFKSGISSLMPLALLILVIENRKAWRTWPRWVFLSLGMIVVLYVYNLIIGGDYFAFQRFLLPCFPFTGLVVWWFWRNKEQIACDKKNAPAGENPQSRLRLSPVGFSVLVVACLIVWSNFIPLGHLTEHKIFQRSVKPSIKVGVAFNESVPKDAIVATIPIGAFGYFSGKKIIDILGLTDKYVAHLNIRTGKRTVGHEKFDYAYVLRKKPHIILQLPILFSGDEDGLKSWMQETTVEISQYAIYDQPELQADYALAWMPIEKMNLDSVKNPNGKKYLGCFAYLRRDLIGSPDYSGWVHLPESEDWIPFVEYKEYVEQNKRFFGNHYLGMWKFSTDSTEPGTTIHRPEFKDLKSKP